MDRQQETDSVRVTQNRSEEIMKIKTSSEKYAVSYTDTFDKVAREGKFLSISEGYPVEDMVRFIRACRECGYPQLLLINGENRAVGWCDIVRRADEPEDVGFLGVGILKEYRHRGLGSRLMTATIGAALRRGFHEIRLEVRTSNENAIRTYQRLGFVKIAHIANGVVTDGVAEDIWLMSLYRRQLERTRFNGEKFMARFPSVSYRFRPTNQDSKQTGGDSV